MKNSKEFEEDKSPTVLKTPRDKGDMLNGTAELTKNLNHENNYESVKQIMKNYKVLRAFEDKMKK